MRSPLKEQYHISPEEKIVLYSGAIGEKQGLDSILSAAKDLSSQKIRFIICGSGPYKEKLSLKARRMGLNNILFLPLQPKERFNEFLNMADLHLVLQKGNASDLVMPSKLSTILSVGGLAIVTAARKTSLYNIITRHDMGIVIDPENQSALVDSIRSAIEHSYTSMKANARNFAMEFLTINNVIEKFMSEISPPVRESVKEVILKKTHAEADLIS
jgi:colanic acid biosynthesis glycosyl transferase WcaI